MSWLLYNSQHIFTALQFFPGVMHFLLTGQITKGQLPVFYWDWMWDIQTRCWQSEEFRPLLAVQGMDMGCTEPQPEL